MTELLAPAGDFITLKATIASGADAVYLGLSAFNARIKATNFNADNIYEAVKYCHIFGCKVFVTLNTSIKNNEIEEVKKSIILCKNANIDAFIISDLAVLDLIKTYAPNIAVHASTQFGVCNLEGALFAQKLGFKRVILSRETTISDIINIKKNTNLEIEYFVHGALCVAFSGKCLLSSVINGGSGNRGRCLQLCRLTYTEINTNNCGYLLSTSDLCLINKLNELIDAGVTSFKIEGRLRRPEYVYKTVKTYRKALNGEKLDSNDIDNLKSAYNRGNFTEGYVDNSNDCIINSSAQGNIGQRVGKITKITNDGYVFLDSNFTPKIGLGYKLMDKSGKEISGGKITEINNNHPKINGAKVNTYLNITSDDTFEFALKKIPLKCNYEIKDGILSVEYYSSTHNLAVKKTLETKLIKSTKISNNSRLESSLKKTGNNPYFFVDEINSLSDGYYIFSISTVNEFRRNLLEELSDKCNNSYKTEKINTNFNKTTIQNRLNNSSLIAVELQSPNQLSSELIDCCNLIVYNPFVMNEKTSKDFLSYVHGKEVYLKLPVNAREKDMELLYDVLNKNKFSGVLTDNAYGITVAKKLGLKIFLGQGLNIYNNISLNYLPHDYYMASPELNYAELKNFSSPFVFAYGYMPLMNLSHCPVKLNYNNTCSLCKYSKPLIYRDRKKYEFTLIRNKYSNCYFTLYNSIITDISSKYLNCDFNYYLNMLQCNCQKAYEIARAFKFGEKTNIADYTFGHMQRGVL